MSTFRIEARVFGEGLAFVSSEADKSLVVEILEGEIEQAGDRSDEGKATCGRGGEELRTHTGI